MDIRTIPLSDLPDSLREIPQPPEQLWAAGTLPPAGTKLLTVVGSRALSAYGREACESLIQGLAGYPVSIVSGLAFGADACAHNAALAAGLHTIAVPGSGLGPNVLYPRAHAGLAKKIVHVGGLLLSEHPPEYAAHKYDFPSRNRIMVGLADAVLMIEAGERSGTLITARLAGDYNRHLLCVPHRIGDRHGYGSHLFTRLGATLVSNSEHILEALGIEPRTERTQLHALASSAEQLLFALLDQPRSRDELIRASTLAPHETLSTLILLELRGAVTQKFGLWKRTF